MILIIYLIGAILAIIASYYLIYTRASKGSYFKIIDLQMCLALGLMSWVGFIEASLIVLKARDYKLWKMK
jgi:hypothetical protein